ncbi:MAG: Peptide chain release factor 1 [Firmicutes bacterium ADurb.Bin182]|nr:MAG: Peptide chain release factor 1 [Firmicutes bacterium ADurb.Bin182]
MIEKLNSIKQRYEQLSEILSAPDAMANQEKWRSNVKEHSDLSEIVAAYDEYIRTKDALAEINAMLQEPLEPEFKELVHQEQSELHEKLAQIEDSIKGMLLPKDKNDERNVIIEIRAGTGGEEAALFASNLLRMYQRYAERHGYKAEIITLSETEMGGVKEAVMSLAGRGAYSRLKYESGVHRVQRVPETESQGRIHTSAATVAVLPEAEDVEIQINPGDIRIDTYRSSGAGGQHVNKTESAVRITHVPTGLVVQCQDEKSQIKNREQAMRVLKTRLYELYRAEREAAEASTRKSQVGSGDRSERIRTYNFPQGRVSDHRVNLTLYKLESFIDGDMDEIIDALILYDRAKRLSEDSGQ